MRYLRLSGKDKVLARGAVSGAECYRIQHVLQASGVGADWSREQSGDKSLPDREPYQKIIIFVRLNLLSLLTQLTKFSAAAAPPSRSRYLLRKQ